MSAVPKEIIVDGRRYTIADPVQAPVQAPAQAPAQARAASSRRKKARARAKAKSVAPVDICEHPLPVDFPVADDPVIQIRILRDCVREEQVKVSRLETQLAKALCANELLSSQLAELCDVDRAAHQQTRHEDSFHGVDERTLARRARQIATDREYAERLQAKINQ